jgi:hypothetical protein
VGHKQSFLIQTPVVGIVARQTYNELSKRAMLGFNVYRAPVLLDDSWVIDSASSVPSPGRSTPD